jgi:hypothetical protein
MEFSEGAKRYRAKAEEWRLFSELAHSDGARRDYLKIADSYDTIAEDMEFLAKRTLPAE